MANSAVARSMSSPNPAPTRFTATLFEFLRNTDLDARNYFSPTRGDVRPKSVRRDLRRAHPQEQDILLRRLSGDSIDARSGYRPNSRSFAQDRTGNLSDLASSFVTTDAHGNTVPTTVSGRILGRRCFRKGWAMRYRRANLITLLAAPLRHACFPNAVIPQSAWSAPATNSVAIYSHFQTTRNGTFSTSAFNQTLRDDKGAYRLDANTRWGLLSAYYFLDNWSQNNPYPVAQGGANVPGFNALYTGRAQLIDLGDTKTLAPTAVNEFHFSYLRDANDLGQTRRRSRSQSGLAGIRRRAGNAGNRGACRRKPKAWRVSGSTASRSAPIPMN